VDLGLDGARVLVCGGSAGLGRAVAEALAAEGARVAIAARPSDRLTAAAEGIPAVAVPADLSTASGPSDAVESAAGQLGGLDLLLVNSGGPRPGRFDELSDADWTAALDGTLWSTLRLIRSALPHLRGSERAAIAVILSSTAREPIPGLTASNLIRPGLVGLIKSLAAEIAPIRINGIAPGRVATARIAEVEEAQAARSGRTVEQIRQSTLDQIPLGRYAEPAEVGRVAAFLLSPAASYMTGTTLLVDGGLIKGLP
jgi:3-oxoacyl-[acyl-carrier protein] reductase